MLHAQTLSTVFVCGAVLKPNKGREFKIFMLKLKQFSAYFYICFVFESGMLYFSQHAQHKQPNNDDITSKKNSFTSFFWFLYTYKHTNILVFICWHNTFLANMPKKLAFSLLCFRSQIVKRVTLPNPSKQSFYV